MALGGKVSQGSVAVKCPTAGVDQEEDEEGATEHDQAGAVVCPARLETGCGGVVRIVEYRD